MMFRSYLLIIMTIWSTLSLAVSERESLATPEKQQRFEHLTHQLRCLVCQNQALSDSDAPLAKDLRHQIATMINKDEADTQIIQYLVQRYGQFILYNTPFMNTTFLLWVGPFLLLLIGVSAIVWQVKE